MHVYIRSICTLYHVYIYHVPILALCHAKISQPNWTGRAGAEGSWVTISRHKWEYNHIKPQHITTMRIEYQANGQHT